jgi:hypothetical protein
VQSPAPYGVPRGLKYGAELVTCDAHFDGLPNVIYLPET